MFGAKAQRASLLGDFCNKIGTHATCPDEVLRSAFGSRARSEMMTEYGLSSFLVDRGHKGAG